MVEEAEEGETVVVVVVEVVVGGGGELDRRGEERERRSGEGERGGGGGDRGRREGEEVAGRREGGEVRRLPTLAGSWAQTALIFRPRSYLRRGGHPTCASLLVALFLVVTAAAAMSPTTRICDGVIVIVFDTDDFCVTRHPPRQLRERGA